MKVAQFTVPNRITLKELHAATGDHVRRAGAARAPVFITDRGQPVAVLANPVLLKTPRRKRKLLPEFERMFARKPAGGDVVEDLDAVRGDR